MPSSVSGLPTSPGENDGSSKSVSCSEQCQNSSLEKCVVIQDVDEVQGVVVYEDEEYRAFHPA